MSNAEQFDSVQRDGWDIVRDIVRDSTDEEFDALIAALDEQVERQSDVRRILRASLPEKHRGEVNLFMSATVAFLAGWMGAGRPEGLDVRIARRAFPKDGFEAERAKAIRLMKARALLLTAGALTAQRARGLNVMQVGLSMDLTPINWSDEPGAALLPGFQLAIDTYDVLDPSTEKRQLVTIDLDDVRGLKKEIDEVLGNLEKLQVFYGERDILIWGAKGPEEDE
ncbi:MAG: hypothetical protein ACQEW8_04515 [Actinomycetota bacterium]